MDMKSDLSYKFANAKVATKVFAILATRLLFWDSITNYLTSARHLTTARACFFVVSYLVLVFSNQKNISIIIHMFFL